MTTDALKEYARDKLRDSIQFLLDDPHGTLATGTPDAEPIGPYVDKLRALCAEVDLDFDAVAAEEGTPFELERLRKLLAGESA